jgi:DivIVA domain-containing protein
MELSPKVFRDVQFREKARGGYHPEDVDEFLEQAAVGAEALLDRLRDATERAERAEKTATEASATDDALKRMLLMGQRTVDQAITEARDEADQLLAAARAQASSLVADAEERGRRAYEDSLAESRSRMEAAGQALRQAEQEVEALRGWVDVNRSHLLAVMRDAQALIENAGLLSQPPPSSDRVAPGEAAGSSTADSDAPAGPAAASPIGASAVGAGAVGAGAVGAGAVGASAVGAGALAGSAAPAVTSTTGANSAGPNQSSLNQGGHTQVSDETEAYSLEEDNAPTGEWDARLLDEVAREDPVSTAAPSNGSEEPGAPGDVNNLHPVTTGSPEDQGGEGVHASPGDQTLAFDERALDSFFNEQDLGDERGIGRFRRRQ